MCVCWVIWNDALGKFISTWKATVESHSPHVTFMVNSLVHLIIETFNMRLLLKGHHVQPVICKVHRTTDSGFFVIHPVTHPLNNRNLEDNLKVNSWTHGFQSGRFFNNNKCMLVIILLIQLVYLSLHSTVSVIYYIRVQFRHQY